MSEPAREPKVRPCPICKSAAVDAYRPFCSKRCADIDLGKWFKDSYTIPGSENGDDSEGLAKPGQNDDGEAH
ncbi:MAG: DNA gyrase inhibitor YacG [Hyphomicrobium sp.]|nr:DNA gyrase inhibitor YacG [Hyphomicrobium sp.]